MAPCAHRFRSVLRFVYIALAYLLIPVLVGVILWRGWSNRGYWSALHERFGFGPPVARGASIWIHGVSVGEVQAAAPLVQTLQDMYPDKTVVITTGTPTGRERARLLFGHTVDLRFVPYDLPGAVKRFFNRVRPELAVIMETELWPNLFNECGRRHVPLVLASARISPRSLKRYRRLVSLFREALSHGIVIAAQSEIDAERFKLVGAAPQRTHVVGNLKFDFELPADIPERGRVFRERQASLRPTWLAASTHAGEEEMVLAAHRRLCEQWPDLLLILVPRHPERFDAVARLVEREGFGCVRRSSGEALREDVSVFVVDTLGELMMFYAAADVALVAGSLVPIGGHNLLEPAALGLPLLTGPYTFKSEGIPELFIDAGAARVVGNAAEIAAAVSELLADAGLRQRLGQLGKKILEDNRGTLDRLLALLAPLLRQSCGSPRTPQRETAKSLDAPGTRANCRTRD